MAHLLPLTTPTASTWTLIAFCALIALVAAYAVIRFVVKRR